MKSRFLLVVAAFLVLAALTGPSARIGGPILRRTLVFDNSRSALPDVQKLRRFAETFTADLRSNDRWSLWVFGGSPALVVAPRSGMPSDLPALPLPDDASDISGALKAAAEETDEIVLSSDGRDTVGGARLPDWSAISVPVFPVLTEGGPPVDVRVVSVVGPGTVGVGEPLAIEAMIVGTYTCDVLIEILRDGNVVDSIAASIGRQGYNLSFRDSLDARGLHTYTVRASAVGDEFPENDEVRVGVAVGPDRAVLLVSPFGEKSSVYRILARAPGLSVTVCAPGGAIRSGDIPRTSDMHTGTFLARPSDMHTGTFLARPSDMHTGTFLARPSEARDRGVSPRNNPRVVSPIRELLGVCSTVILEGFGAGEISSDVQASLASWVRDGGGLVVISGGPGRDCSDLSKTALGDLLSVEFGIETGSHLVLALDRSGSMAQAAGSSVKLEMAVMATLDAARFVGPSDRFDVISFAGSAKREYSGIGRPGGGKLSGSLSQISAGGGTRLRDALDMAWKIFRKGGRAQRGLIIISDGFAEDNEIDGALTDLKKAGVRVSAVGVGDEVNEKLLSRLASETGGTWVRLNDAAGLPEEVGRRAKVVLSQSFASGNFDVILGPAHPAFNIKNSPPSVGGFTRCRARQGASSPIMAAQGDPLVTLRRVSAGRSAFIAVALVEQYASKWLSWPGLQGVVEGSVKWCAGPRPEPKKELPDTGAPASVTAAVSDLPYAREFTALGEDRATLEQIASATGGKTLAPGELPGAAAAGRQRRPLAPLLAALAVLCVVGHVALPRAGGAQRGD